MLYTRPFRFSGDRYQLKKNLVGIVAVRRKYYLSLIPGIERVFKSSVTEFSKCASLLELRIINHVIRQLELCKKQNPKHPENWIISSAIRIPPDNVVYGIRHSDALALAILTRKGIREQVSRAEQGFIALGSTDVELLRFVSRTEAYQLAIATGQVDEDTLYPPRTGRVLFSEDLW